MEDDEAQEEEFVGVVGFFPSHNVFMNPLVFPGKLTLDAVKIDCSDFFQESLWTENHRQEAKNWLNGECLQWNCLNPERWIIALLVFSLLWLLLST